MFNFNKNELKQIKGKDKVHINKTTKDVPLN